MATGGASGCGTPSTVNGSPICEAQSNPDLTAGIVTGEATTEPTPFDRGRTTSGGGQSHQPKFTHLGPLAQSRYRQGAEGGGHRQWCCDYPESGSAADRRLGAG